MKLLLVAPLAAFALPASAQAQNWNKATPINVTVTDDRFIPARVSLKQGRPYVLRLHNSGTRKHNFSSDRFFKYARVRQSDSGWIVHNEVSLAPGQTARLHIVAPATPNAAYDFRSTRVSDAAEKMKGTIFVN
jgi:uncharacterized cupredoxin-like copper-binding protein